MGVKRDNVPFAGVNEGTESPNKVAKRAKLRFAAGLDLLTLKQSKLTIHNCGVPYDSPEQCVKHTGGRTPFPTVHITVNKSQGIPVKSPKSLDK